MYKVAIYKRDKGCTGCMILDKIFPNVRAELGRPDIQWDEVKISVENPDNIVVPKEVHGFPTTLVFKDGQLLGVVRGYEDWKNSVDRLVN